MCEGGCAKCNAHFMEILNISKICKENVQQRAKKATILSREKISPFERFCKNFSTFSAFICYSFFPWNIYPSPDADSDEVCVC